MLSTEDPTKEGSATAVVPEAPISSPRAHHRGTGCPVLGETVRKCIYQQICGADSSSMIICKRMEKGFKKQTITHISDWPFIENECLVLRRLQEDTHMTYIIPWQIATLAAP